LISPALIRRPKANPRFSFQEQRPILNIPAVKVTVPFYSPKMAFFQPPRLTFAAQNYPGKLHLVPEVSTSRRV